MMLKSSYQNKVSFCYLIMIPLLELFVTINCYPQTVNSNNSKGNESLKARRKELIRHGGLKAACTYSDFLSFNQYKGNLHCHSYHSDGSQYCDETALWYYNNGYQVLSITDHDAYGDQDGGLVKNMKFQTDSVVHDWDGDGVIHNMWEYRSGAEVYIRDYSKPAFPWVPRNWQLEKPGKFIILNGIEYSFGHPHINAINHPAGPNIRPRESYKFIDYVHSNNGLVFLNHPEEYGNDPSEVFKDPDLCRLDGLEVMNGFNARDNRNGNNPDGSPGIFEVLWDACLNAGLHFWGFANDDSHNVDTSYLTNVEWFASAGSAWNMLWAKELTRPAIVEALKAGAFYGSCGIKIENVRVTRKYITVTSSNATHIKVIGDGGRILMSVDAPGIKYVLRGDEKWIRIDLWNDTLCYPGTLPQYTQKAWLQPILLDKLLTKTN
jgi:hypothetical protein